MQYWNRNAGRAFIALMAVAVGATAASAQSRQNQSLFGTSGPTSQGSLGGIRTSSGSGYGNTIPGFGTMQGFGTGTGGTNSGFGTSGFGMSGGLGTSAAGQQGQAAGSGFVGRNATQTGFVGAQQAQGQTGQRLGLGAGQLGGLNGLSNFNRQGANGFGQNQQQQPGSGNEQLPVRIRPQVAFEFSAPTPQAVASSAQVRFDSITNRGPQFKDVNFTMDGSGQVTLIGSVPNENARSVAAALLRLEPGVRSVKNELEVKP